MANEGRIADGRQSREIWKAISEYDGYYEASNLGRIRRLTRRGKDGRLWKGRVLKQRLNIHGYFQVTLSCDGQQCCRTVHGLVCLAFHGPRPPRHEVSHLDGNRANNAADNLRWSTHAENERMKWLHGSLPLGKKNGRHTKPWAYPVGESHPQSKLTERQVVAIRKAHANRGIGAHQLAQIVGVSKTAIRQILSDRTWRAG